MVPATVSLLCICIVFVPMFGLGGVAGYLFRPLAEAVVFAMIGSYILSRTLVPTMANFLLRKHVHQEGHGCQAKFLRALPESGFERNFERVRGGYVGLLELALSAPPACHPRLSLPQCCFPSVWSRSLGRNFFPAVDSDQIKLHVRAQTGTRIEDASALCGRIEAGHPRSRHPAPRTWIRSLTISACPSAASIWPTAILAPSAAATRTSSSR